MIIAWDFDGVLNRNHDGARYVWEDEFARLVGQPASAFGAFVFGEKPSVITGEIDILDRLQEWTEATPCLITADEILDRWLAMDARPDADMITLVEQLGAAGHRQIIATNNEARRAAYIGDQMGMAAQVERIFASGPMGLAKPDPRYFQHITAELGADPDAMIFIDDRQDNVDAALSLGWNGFHFTDQTRAILPDFLECFLVKAAVARGPQERLATYGTLAPGKVNHHVVGDMAGEWSEGTVHGRLVQEGWGAAHGSPGIMLDPAGDPVPVHLFTSADLPAHWARLDAFEGPGYRRTPVTVQTADGPVIASIYALADPGV